MQSRLSHSGLLIASLACVAGLLVIAFAPVGRDAEGRAVADGQTAAVSSVRSLAASLPPSLAQSPSIGAAIKILAVRKFAHDKRQPRPPRHRSERASSFAAEHDLTAAVIYSITHDDAHCPLVADVMSANPLSGHPLELLRPPSLRA